MSHILNGEIHMRTSHNLLLVLLLGLVFTCNAQAGAPPGYIQEKVQELGFKVGAETDAIPGRLINERTWVDKRHIIVPGTDQRSYLVRFYQTCQGTWSKTMVPRSNKTGGQISRYDRYATRHEGSNIAICQIWHIYELEPV